MQAISLIRAAWILSVFLLAFFAFPGYLFSGGENSRIVLRVAGNLVRMLLVVTAGGVLLASLKIFNTTTVASLFLGTIAIVWVRKRAKTSRNWLTALQEAVIRVVRVVEERTIFHPLDGPAPAEQKLWMKWWQKVLRGRETVTAAFAVVLIITAVLQFAHPLMQLRLGRPEQYEALLRARELMLNLHVYERPIVFPSVVAAVSFLSSADPMQVTRFLCPLLQIFVVLAGGLLIRECTKSTIAGVGAMYLLGTSALWPKATETTEPLSTMEKVGNFFRSSLTGNGSNPEIVVGLLCVLLAVVFLAEWRKNAGDWNSLVDAGCCLVLAGLTSQFLLIVGAIAAGAVLLLPLLGVAAFVLISYGWAAFAAFSTTVSVPNELRLTLPVAAALCLCGSLGIVESKLVARMGSMAQALLLLGCIIIAAAWLRPRTVASHYLEYDQAATETQAIAERFPRQRWVVVAPTEQLPETLGLGGYEDLAEFVGKYEKKASDPAFRIPDAPEDLFIYVEKTPFQYFDREPDSVPADVLVDTTYRSYRSPAGRSSLESAALRLCENYRLTHEDADIFFEDDNLRIYHVHRVSIQKAGAGG
jgi:hypothetical protein